MKKIKSFLLIAILLLALPIKANAQESTNNKSMVETFLNQEGYTIISSEINTLSPEELNDYVVVRDISNATSLAINSSAKISANDIMGVNAIKEHYTVEKDGIVENIYSITAMSEDKYSINQTGELIGTICWKDNFGPRNQLIYVSGTYSPGFTSPRTNNYYYWKVGWETTTRVTGYWTGGLFNAYPTDYYGLQFSLHIGTADGVTVQVTTFPTD